MHSVEHSLHCLLFPQPNNLFHQLPRLHGENVNTSLAASIRGTQFIHTSLAAANCSKYLLGHLEISMSNSIVYSEELT